MGWQAVRSFDSKENWPVGHEPKIRRNCADLTPHMPHRHVPTRLEMTLHFVKSL
jgi:hypothetical protein